MNFATIEFQIADRVATIGLNRPERLNAWTPAMQVELCEALNLSDEDDGVRAVIVTGVGRAFCAGADISGGPDTLDPSGAAGQGMVPRDSGGRFALRVFDSKKPVIAAINGAAVGIGATMTLPMDIRLASSSARIGFVFARSRRLLWDMLAEGHPMAAHRADSRGLLERGGSGDVSEGIRAFLEKRPADFPDRVSTGLPNLTPWREPPIFS